jgi:hypothetical protein
VGFANCKDNDACIIFRFVKERVSMLRSSIHWPAICGLALLTAASAERCVAQSSLSMKSAAGIAAEERILQALEQPVSLQLVETRLKDVAVRLQNEYRISIQLDDKALTDAGVNADTPVTASFNNVRLRTALEMILLRHELNWIIQDDVLVITTGAKAKEHIETHIYPVRDLVEVYDEQGVAEDYNSLIDVITSTISPPSWTDAGGTGSVAAFSNSRALVISQTREVHEQLNALFAALRAARDQQGIAAAYSSRESRRDVADDAADQLDESAEIEPQPQVRWRVVDAPPAWRVPKVYK